MAEAYEWFDQKRTMEILDETKIVPSAKPNEPAPEQASVAQPPLCAASQQWYANLPPAVRPQVLRCQFPHIIDRLQQSWETPRRLDQLFAQLMVDDRGGRQGFPFSVIREMHCLRDFYFEVLNPGAKTLIKPKAGMKSNL